MTITSASYLRNSPIPFLLLARSHSSIQFLNLMTATIASSQYVEDLKAVQRTSRQEKTYQDCGVQSSRLTSQIEFVSSDA